MRKTLLRTLVVGGVFDKHGAVETRGLPVCPDGRLQAKAQFTFKDETLLQGTVFKPCTIKK